MIAQSAFLCALLPKVVSLSKSPFFADPFFSSSFGFCTEVVTEPANFWSGVVSWETRFLRELPFVVNILNWLLYWTAVLGVRGIATRGCTWCAGVRQQGDWAALSSMTARSVISVTYRYVRIPHCSLKHGEMVFGPTRVASLAELRVRRKIGGKYCVLKHRHSSFHNRFSRTQDQKKEERSTSMSFKRGAGGRSRSDRARQASP